ncbi:MAG: hypothetical protein WC233_08520 [Sphaerochaeta sp.]|jgi:hypothetical protein|nr:hypothetical protein [Spirochaetales bacterium]
MYVPILKNRAIEISVIKELVEGNLTNNTIPLFEIVQEKSRSNSKKTYIDELREIFSKSRNRFLIDFPQLDVTAATSDSMRNFLIQVNRNKDFIFEQFNQCKNIDNAIPVISFRKNDLVSSEQINERIHKLRQDFTNLALRLTPSQASEQTLLELRLQEGDMVILDIDDNSHTNPIFKINYKALRELKRTHAIRTIIANSHRPTSMLNKNIRDGLPIEEIDNSLLELYKTNTYGFDGFADYASVTKTLPTTGGSISPAGVYYSFESNYFVGFRGETSLLNEFQDHIAPAIINSPYWREFSDHHHDQCPGCRKIKDIKEAIQSGKSQGLWKGITMSHYIYTLDENNV